LTDIPIDCELSGYEIDEVELRSKEFLGF